MTKISQQRLREILNYNPDTGDFTWRLQIAKRAQIGAVAGGLSHTGYVFIRIEGTAYLAHRLAWLYVHGEWPEGDLDHRDCDPSNNRLSNLRPATPVQNNWNTRKSKNNTSGFKGVHWANQAQRWMARIQINARRVYLGHFDTPEAAHTAYCDAAREHFGEFARFE